MKVVWTPGAEQDREAIFEHIAADNPAAAVRMDALFGDAAARELARDLAGPRPVRGLLAGIDTYVDRDDDRV